MADEFEKATPRPWTLEHSHISAWGIAPRYGRVFTSDIGYDDWSNPELSVSYANARLIVAAVNERDALREEIRRLRDALLSARWRLSKGRALWNGPGVDIRNQASDREIADIDAGERNVLERIRKLLEGGNGENDG